MKILFKNNTKCTKENYNAFIKFHQKKYGKKIIMQIVLILLCVLYILIYNLIHKNWKVIFILIIIGIIAYIMRKITLSAQKKNNKKIIKSKKEFNFYFYEKYIKIKCGRKFDRLKYFELYKIFETQEYFFLYTDENHSLILTKNGFEIGTPKEFSEFIKKKCLFKYKQEKN